MNRRFLTPLGMLCALAFLAGGCTSDVSTEQLSISFKDISVVMEKKDGANSLTANLVVPLVNRTERAMNVAFLEGSIIDASTSKVLARFRPIIPQSYGTISSAALLPKQVKDFPVITPPELEPFNTTTSPSVLISINFQTTDGFRTTKDSAPVAVINK